LNEPTPGGQQHGRRGLARRRNVKRSEQLALHIVEDIVRRDFGPGAKLPLEAEMVEEYGVSRASLREALRLLEVQGLITIRPGPGAGTEVGRPDPANLANTLALYLLMGRSTLRQLLDAWLIVEPLLAQLAAASTDRERVQRLLSPFASGVTRPERELAAGLAFHDTIADLADNPLLGLLFGAIGFLVTEQVRLGAPDFELSEDTICAHERIADCVLAGDEAGAYASMRSHLVTVLAEIEKVLPGLDRPFRLRG
jgi:DNA-binding FadR family transcriptional regulator